MSAQVEAAPITIQPVVDAPKATEEAASAAVISGPGPVVEGENVAPVAADDGKTTTTIKETEVGKPASSPTKEHRTPFANLINGVFGGKKSEKVAAEKPVEKAPEPVVVAPEVEAPAAEVAPVVEATEADKAEPAVVEAESPKKKEGFVEKIKHILSSDKKVTPKKASKEPAVEDKKEETAPVATELPEPVPSAPLDMTTTSVEEPKTDAQKAAEVVEAPVASAEATETPVEATKEESKEETKEEKAKKAKIGRRLSAKFFGSFSPKKEKSNPLADKSEKSPVEDKSPAALPVTREEEVKAEEAPAAPAKVEEPSVVEAPVEPEAAKVAEEPTKPSVEEVAATTEVAPLEATEEPKPVASTTA